MKSGIALVFSSLLLLAGCAGSYPEGPCDIYNAGGTECVAAHSTTRVLYSKYSGPLYQVMRASDGQLLDIYPLKDGYADAAAQDAFLNGELGYITMIYDQSGKGNDLLQASPGTFKGPAKGEFNTLPIADMAPIVIDGHNVYGAYFMPGMGLRNNNASYLAIDDEPEGIYYVIDGTHYDSGCCFDYGNSSTNGRAVGRGTMETTYFGTSTAWGRGNDEGPWIMADMEGGLFSGWNAKQNDVPSIKDWRFVSVFVNGGGGNRWDLRGGDATSEEVVTFYEGERPESTDPVEDYYPMHKKGGILLGNGGDNGNGSAGTFYEGVMTIGYPSEETCVKVQQNIASVKYATNPLSLSRLTSFDLYNGKNMSVMFTNTTSSKISGLHIEVEGTEGWSGVMTSALGGFRDLAPGENQFFVFQVNGPDVDNMGIIKAVATWDGGGRAEAMQRVRSVSSVVINELCLSDGQFIELYNNRGVSVDLSGWEIEVTRSGWAPLRVAKFPEGTVLEGDSYMVLRPSIEAQVADKLPVTTIFTPVSTGPWMDIPAGSDCLYLASVEGLYEGQKLGVDAGGNYEEVTVLEVGTAATQTVTTCELKAGDAQIAVKDASRLLPGMEITISTGQRTEKRLVKEVADTIVVLEEPLSMDQIAYVDVSATGTGVKVTPLKYNHRSGDAVEVLAENEAEPSSNAPAHTMVCDGQHYGYTFSPKAGAVAIYNGDVLVDAIIYGSKQSNSSANGTIARPDIAIYEGNQTQGGCLAEVPMRFWFTVGFRPGMVPPFNRWAPRMMGDPKPCSLVRVPDGYDPDALCEIKNTETPTPGASNR